MKIDIKQTTKVPLQIGTLNFELDFSDDKLINLADNFNDVMNKLSEVDSKDFEAVKQGMKTVVDMFIEDGAFEVIYKEYPSITIVTEIIEKLAVGITEEIKKRGVKSKEVVAVEAYLKKNNKK